MVVIQWPKKISYYACPYCKTRYPKPENPKQIIRECRKFELEKEENGFSDRLSETVGHERKNNDFFNAIEIVQNNLI